MYVIDKNKCTGCSACMRACEASAIYLVDNTAEIDPKLCTDCGACIAVCPVEAISEKAPEIQPRQQAEHPSAKHSILAAAKSAAVSIGSALLPVVISRIGDLFTQKLDNRSQSLSSGKQLFRRNGQGGRKRNRRGGRGGRMF
jgi:NAD-dependent dihydropyrimidine dehydrogenase PreA subunit